VLTASGGIHVTVDTPNRLPQAQPSQTGASDRTRFCTLELCWYAAALFVVIAAGLIRVEMPLNGDQALFLAYARRFDEGLQLYVDLWDVKPPAVFAFYYLGGSLFGFTDRGIHLFELLWMVVLAIAMILGLRPHLRQPWLAAVAPLAALGSYYGSCSFQEQTQIESLVNLPMCLSVLALAAAGRSAASRSNYAALAGVAAAVATLFKVVFAPIFIGLLLVTVAAVARAEASRTVTRRCCVCVSPTRWVRLLFGLRASSCLLRSARLMRCCGRCSSIRPKRLPTSSLHR
jgi:dolichyl-phosphate-mannose-protein mannosyltransferase